MRQANAQEYRLSFVPQTVDVNWRQAQAVAASPERIGRASIAFESPQGNARGSEGARGEEGSVFSTLVSLVHGLTTMNAAVPPIRLTGDVIV
jgi:hypothetical protein